MGNKKILIVSRAFYPMVAPRSYRATELAKEFARQGHDVTVLIHKKEFDYTDFQVKYNLTIRDFVNGQWYDIPKTSNPLVNFLKGVLKYFFIFPDIQLVRLIKKALLCESNYDLLISIAIPYPVHWGVAKAIQKNPKLVKTWVADCGDPFMGNKEQKIKFPFYFHLVENWFCTKPDYISIPIEEAKDAYPEKCRHKIRVIPQGFDFSFSLDGITKNNESRPTFAYAGSLSKGIRDPQGFLKFLTAVEFNFKFICYTKDTALLKPYTNDLGSKLEIRDYIPREELLLELKSMDFLVNFENRDKVQSPSKLIDYALVGRPILSIAHNNSDWNTTLEFLKGNYANAFKLPNLEKYDVKNVSKQFIDLVLSER